MSCRYICTARCVIRAWWLRTENSLQCVVVWVIFETSHEFLIKIWYLCKVGNLPLFGRFVLLFGEGNTTAPSGPGVSSFTRFLDHTQRRITVGRTPLYEWSARRRDLYLTTHNTPNRQTSMPPVRFEPTISAGERPKTYALDRAATGTGLCGRYEQKFHIGWLQMQVSCCDAYHLTFTTACQ
jgi:hypothetical protein